MPFRFKTEDGALIRHLYFVFYNFLCLSVFFFYYSIYENILGVLFFKQCYFHYQLYRYQIIHNAVSLMSSRMFLEFQN